MRKDPLPKGNREGRFPKVGVQELARRGGMGCRQEPCSGARIQEWLPGLGESQGWKNTPVEAPHPPRDAWPQPAFTAPALYVSQG